MTKSHENTSKYVDTVTFFKNLNQRSLTPRWPLTSCLLRSHVWLFSRIIVSKSHGNTAMHVDKVINFAKYHIHIPIHITYSWYILRTEWVITKSLSEHVQARQKWHITITFYGYFHPPPQHISHLYAKLCQILNPVIWNFECILITQVTCQRWFWITCYYLCTGSTGWQHVGLHLKVMKQIKLVSYIFILT